MARNLQDHILETASQLFYSQGIKATGIDAIVKASGVAKMSLYKYFPSKDDLVLAYLRRRGEAMKNRIQCGIELKNCLPKQKLLAVFEVFEEILAAPDFRGCPFVNASAEFAEAANPVLLASNEFYNTFCAMLTDIAQQAGISEPEELSKQLAMLIVGATVREQMHRQSGAMRTAYAVADILIEKSYAPF